MNNMPSDSLFNKINTLHILLMRAFQQDAQSGRHDASRGQGRVLALLALKPEISQKELTYLLGVSRQAMAELLAKLERAGFITRAASPDDPRAKIVHLTEDGAKEASQRKQSEDSDSIFACLTDEEQDTLRALLDKLIARAEENFPGIDFDARRQYMQAFRNQFSGTRPQPEDFAEHCPGEDVDTHMKRMQDFHDSFADAPDSDERWQEFRQRLQNATPEERERLHRHWEYFRSIQRPER